MGKLPLMQISWAIALGFLVLSLVGQYGGSEPIPYSRFQQLLESGQIAKAVVSGDQIRGDFKEKQPNGATSFVMASAHALLVSTHGLGLRFPSTVIVQGLPLRNPPTNLPEAESRIWPPRSAPLAPVERVTVKSDGPASVCMVFRPLVFPGSLVMI